MWPPPVQVVAEDVPEISLKFEIVAVPTFVFLKVREQETAPVVW